MLIMSLKIRLTAKAPIKPGIRLKPLSKDSNPKVKRICPIEGSTPGRCTIIPKQAAIKPLINEPWLRLASITNAIRTIVKYSQGPKVSANFASGGDNIAKKSQEIITPIKEEVIHKASARSDFPCWDIGYPSKVVIIEAGVPGILSKVAAIWLPEIPPTYIPINKVIALTLSIKKVKGKVKVINIVVVKPGGGPTTMPRKPPMKRSTFGQN